MRSFPAYDRSSSTKSLTGNTSPGNFASAGNKKNNRPDWMKRLQEQRKAEKEEQENNASFKNCDLNLFSSFKSISSEITYLDDEDDLAESYFPGATKMGSSCSSIDSDDLPAVSGYNFDKIIMNTI